MLGYKWWRYTVNLDEFLATGPSHERDKVRRRVHFNDLWQVTTKDPKTFHVKCLVTIKTRLKFANHYEFINRIREVLKKNPLPTRIKETVDKVKTSVGISADTKEFDLLTALMYTRASQVINMDTIVHLELMINYLAKKQYGVEVYPHRHAGRYTEEIQHYRDLLAAGIAGTIPAPAAPSEPVPVAAGISEEEEKKIVQRIKRKSVMAISEEKVTFD